MPFCTKCGANVTGTFCSQCGTPAAGAAVPAQPAMAAPYPPPMPYGAPPPVRKTSPIVWVLVILLGLLLLGGIGVAGFLAFVGHRLHQAGAGVTFDHRSDGGVTLHTRGADGKSATVEFGSSSGKLPSWVPVYPGSEGRAKFTVSGTSDGEGEGGSFIFTTSDDPARVKSFYSDKAHDMGLKINVDSSTPGGGMISAADEGGDHRSLTVIVGGHPGETSVNVMYGRK
jgi:hypothetical protein